MNPHHYEEKCTGRCTSQIDKELHDLLTNREEIIEREPIDMPLDEQEGVTWRFMTIYPTYPTAI